jgi:intein/homing endonuclease
VRSNLAIDQAALRRDIFEAFLEEGPKTDEELHYWIQTFTGFDVPRRVSGICPSNHVAPFAFVADQFFERVKSSLGFGNRSSGKCIAGDSLIYDPKTGDRVTIREIVEGRGPSSILTLENLSDITTAEITQRHDTGVNPCLRVRLASGRVITTTHEHPFLTPEGWQRADELELGGTVATPIRLPLPKAPVSIPDAHIDLLAILLAEGCYTGRGVSFSTGDIKILELARRACATFDGVAVEHISRYDYAITQGRRRGPRRRNPVRQMLDDYGIANEHAPEKKIPAAIFRLDGEQLARFLTIFWMCDGYVAPNEAGVGLASRAMLEDIQHLLLRLGVQSRLRTRNPKSHVLTVYRASLEAFHAALSLWGYKGENLERLAIIDRRVSSGRPSVTNQLVAEVRGRLAVQSFASRADHSARTAAVRAAVGFTDFACRGGGAGILKHGVKHLKRERLLALCDQGGIGRQGYEHLLSEDLWWDEIVAIEDAGDLHTYDLTMHPTACFVANDIVVHNTRMTAILNLCDLVFKPGIEIVTAGAILPQAQRGYEYLVEFFQREPLLQQLLLTAPTMSKTILKNGSRISIVTASYGGFNGPHPSKLRIDELELVHPNYLAEALSLTQAHPDGWAAQDTFTSTRKVSNGTMQKMLDEAEERNVKVYTFCIFENIEKCTRQCRNDPQYGDCPAYSKKDKNGIEVGICGILDGAAEPHGKAQMVSTGGFYKIEDFVKKVALIDRQTWDAQWENKKPSGGALVYGEFYSDEPPFVVDDEEAKLLLARAKREGNWARCVGIDFGSNFAVEYFMQDPLKAPFGWYAYHEVYMTRTGRSRSARSGSERKIPWAGTSARWSTPIRPASSSSPT